MHADGAKRLGGKMFEGPLRFCTNGKAARATTDCNAKKASLCATDGNAEPKGSQSLHALNHPRKSKTVWSAPAVAQPY
jgi:hypothetical protein